MSLAWPVLAALCCGVAWGAAPSYSVTGIVNASNYAPGPFAPNSILSIFGTDLAISEHVLTSADIVNNTLPTELNSTRVYVDGINVPLFYVAPGQINFLVPSKQSVGPAVIRVSREGLSGPQVTISIVDAAPALFLAPTGFAVASHNADYSLVSPDSPAHGGEVVIVWATGMGKTVTNPQTGEIPSYVSSIVNLPELIVTLNGEAVDPSAVLYAGLSPGCAGLYQINLVLPGDPGVNPEIRVYLGPESSPAGLKLAVE